MLNFKQITIVGCGLLGGSFALALRRAGYTGKITACGGSRGPQLALERGIVDALEISFANQEICQSDFIFLAAPIGGIIDFLKQNSAFIKSGAIITDAGSTKTEICQIAAAVLPPDIYFIGGHPMAGSEHTGVEYSRADLFNGATWALMQDEKTPPELFAQLKNLIEQLGARLVVTDSASHDASVALISHLPQLLSSSLADLLNQPDSELARKLAATGWRDMTRLAGSSWSVWRDIVMTNQPNISAALSQLIANLQQLQEGLTQRDFNQTRELFQQANQSVEQQRALYLREFDKKK